jgi:surfeit locus 1 family protein
MKFGSRTFAPRPFTTVLTLLLLVVLISLGRWQLRRADQKRALYDEFDSGAGATRMIDLQTPLLPRYQHVEARGSYDGMHQILIDNMTDAAGHAGYFVITPFAMAGGGWLLINRGWVSLGASRALLPQVSVTAEVRQVHGRADHLPTANFPARSDIEQLLHVGPWAAATDLVLLDADQTDGYVRQWQPPGMPPMRHIAYAVQWFGLALALAVIYIVTNLRPAPRTPA